VSPLTSPTEIKAYLLAILGADLGLWKDGSPAIWIGTPPSHLAPATGPQLILAPVATGFTSTTGGLKFIDGYFELRVVNAIEGAPSNSLSEITRILQRLPQIRSVVWFPATINTAEQVTAKFHSPGFVPISRSTLFN
jgi:hypothetical protein